MGLVNQLNTDISNQLTGDTEMRRLFTGRDKQDVDRLIDRQILQCEIAAETILCKSKACFEGPGPSKETGIQGALLLCGRNQAILNCVKLYQIGVHRCNRNRYIQSN